MGRRIERMKLLSELKLLDQKEISILSQKARVNWLEHGDTNSKYYHSRIRWRRTNNKVKGIQLNGCWCEEPNRVKRGERVF